MSLSFLHLADLHLDSPFVGVHAVAPEIAAVLREATFGAFDAAVDLAIREGVDLILIAGDVHDGADRSLKAQLRFRDALARAADAGIDSFVVHGNHDPLSGWEAELSWPQRVHRFENTDDVERVTVERNGMAIADVYGISFARRDVTDNLAARFQRDGDAPVAIGLLHCNVGGGGEGSGHENYAPCSLDDLKNAGLDYWALGHVHTREYLRAAGPCVIYSGNTQGRSVRETGPRGGYLVRVGDDGKPQPQFVPTDVVRWFEQLIDVGSLTGLDDLIETLFDHKEEIRTQADGRAAIARLALTGRGELHAVLQREDTTTDLLAKLRENEPGRSDFVWIESLPATTRPAIDVAQRRQVEDFVGDLLRAAEEIRSSDDPAAQLRAVLTSRREHRTIADQIEALTEPDLLEVLSAAEALGLDHLLGEEEGG